MRLLRTAVFTAVCVVLAAAGHGLASGMGVSGWTLPVGFAGVFVITAALAGRERTLLSITAALTAGQLALHVLFGFGRRHGGRRDRVRGRLPDPLRRRAGVRRRTGGADRG